MSNEPQGSGTQGGVRYPPQGGRRILTALSTLQCPGSSEQRFNEKGKELRWREGEEPLETE